MEWKELVSAKRLAEMMDGIKILVQWQESVYYMPILQNQSAIAEEKERIAAVLVDNHLGKLAKQVRMLPDRPGEDPDKFLNHWAEITFIAQLWLQFNHLSEEQQLSLVYQSGPNITKKHLEKELPHSGLFHVVAVEMDREENLQRRTVYFLEWKENEIYFLLDFSFGNRAFESIFEVGETYMGSVIKYPILGYNRVRIGEWRKTTTPQTPTRDRKFQALEELASEFHDSMRENPLLLPRPVIVELYSDFVPSSGWKVMDRFGFVLRLRSGIDEDVLYSFFSSIYKNIAPVMGVWDTSGFFPQSYFNGENFVPFG